MGQYAAAITRGLGWREDDVRNIRLAAPMHDIGKIGIPDSILLKPGRLSEAEFEAVKTHTVIGAKMLDGSRIPLLSLARDIALGHHEKWDGKGYPEGLRGAAIPASARVVAVCDVYDALVSDRVYRPAMAEEDALFIMRQSRESHLDPEALDVFLHMLPEFRGIRGKVSD